AACAAASDHPRTVRAPGSAPWCPWCHDRRSCPSRPHRDPRGSSRCATRAPGAGGAPLAGSARRRPSPAQPCSVDLLDGDEVRHRADHASNLGPVVLADSVANPLQTERAQRVTLVLPAADGGLLLGHLELAHEATSVFSAASARPSAWARSSAAGATWFSASPRRAATASGGSRDFSAVTVACTMLIAFSEPRDLLSTSWMPAQSSTARTGPPAMTPVPGEAGRSSTTPAASSPCTRCGMVLRIIGTLKKFFLASSTPLAMAAGTSLALP